MPDYALLALGNLTSTLVGVEVNRWGTELIVRCLYNPLDPQPYDLIFRGCRRIEFEPYVNDPLNDVSQAEIIGLSLGEKGHQKPAVITSSVVEITVVYSTYELLVHKSSD